MKRRDRLRVDEQFGMFLAMNPMVVAGELAFPRQVATEMVRADHPDTPGTWAAHCRDDVVYPDPSDEAMAEVLSVARLLDPSFESLYEPADPYVVAMAYEISEHYATSTIVVVSDDFVDRGRRESVQTACDRLSLQCWRSDRFIEHMRARMMSSP